MPFIKHKLLILYIIILGFYACKSTKPNSRSNFNDDNQQVSKSPKKDEAKIDKIITTARTYTGVKYKYGGNDRNGIDCSGLACASYKAIDITLPRVAGDQSKIGKRVYIGELKKGDLVFFTDKKGNTKITHVGIVTVVNSNKSVTFIHASTKKGVMENELLTGYYRDIFLKATRILD